MNMHRPNHSTGITFVELMLVVVIIAILAGAAVLHFGGSLDYSKLQHASTRLASDLRLVREHARSTQKPQTLTIDPNHITYSALGVARLEGPQDISVDLAAPPYELTSIICSTSDNQTITFDHNGRASEQGTIFLRRGSKRAIIVITAGGQIEQTE